MMTNKTGSRTSRKKEKTFKKITTVAVDLFNKYGFEAVTMEQIAETVDIAKGTLYNYFPSKESIINGYLQQSFQENNADRIALLRKLPDTRSRLTSIMSILVKGVQRQKKIFEIFMVYRMKQVISFKPVEEGEQTGLSRLIHEIISLGIQEHELRPDLSFELMEDLAEFVIIEAIKPLYLNSDNFDIQQSIERCVDLFIDGTKA
jgi:AcrR family transcriptional regulator